MKGFADDAIMLKERERERGFLNQTIRNKIDYVIAFTMSFTYIL